MTDLIIHRRLFRPFTTNQATDALRLLRELGASTVEIRLSPELLAECGQAALLDTPVLVHAGDEVLVRGTKGHSNFAVVLRSGADLSTSSAVDPVFGRSEAQHEPCGPGLHL